MGGGEGGVGGGTIVLYVDEYCDSNREDDEMST